MLVLSRKTGEMVGIGSEISLVELEASGGRVQIGFAAPAHVRIVHQETFDRLSGASGREGPPEETHHAARNP
jgi:carbon storage regulator CsrA